MAKAYIMQSSQCECCRLPIFTSVLINSDTRSIRFISKASNQLYDGMQGASDVYIISLYKQYYTNIDLTETHIEEKSEHIVLVNILENDILYIYHT